MIGQDDENLVPQLVAAYGLTVLGIRRLPGGLANRTFLVKTTEGPYALTVLGNASVLRATAYADYLSLLQARGVRMARLRQTRAGAPLTLLGRQPALLSTYVRGRCSSRIRARQLSTIATGLADLHGLTGVTTALGSTLRFTETEVEHFDGLRDRAFGRWLRTWHARVHDVVKAPRVRVPTHGDPFPDNFVVRRDGGVVFLDWEDGGLDFPEVDVGMALLGLCGTRRFDTSRAAILLGAYQRRCRTHLDRELLLPITIYLGLYAAFNRYRRYAERLSSQSDPRSYKDIPLLLRSLRAQWRELGRFVHR